MTISDPPPPPRETQRLDAFVDAAFAFAVTLLIIAGAEPLASFQDLQRALMRIPAFAAGFALIAVFWLGHRRFGQIAPRRDGTSVLLSLAIVFWVLVLVFPMRLLTESGAHWLSGRVLPGGDLLRSLEDLRGVYIVYGLGFAILATLYVVLFHHALRRPEAVALAPASVEPARLERRVWLIVAASGVVSALAAALLPLRLAPFLPGFAYWLIPIGLGVAAWLDGRRTRGGGPMSFVVDPAFEAGSVAAAEWPLCHVRLQDDARFPWLILIPRRAGLVELDELSREDRLALMDEIVRAGEVVRRLAEPPVEKLNVAAIGNVTAQLHVHVVGRRRDDGLWPDPVWGRGPAVPYAPAERARLLASI